MQGKLPEATKVKREIQVIDRELYHLREVQRKYSKRMLRGATVIWAFGVLIFAISALMSFGTEVLLRTLNIWVPLVIVALSAPIFISALFMRRLEKKEKRMELMRKNLMERFEQAMLKRVEKMVKKREPPA